MTDPMLGGATVELNPGKAYTARELSSLAQGGIRDQAPKQRFASETQAPVQQPQPVRQQVSRRMCVVGYKGTADAWLASFRKLQEVNGQQIDRNFYLALDPREAHRQGELMEVGTDTFQQFVIIPYRYPIPTNPIGLPAPKNLHALVGKSTEEYRNAGPCLICLPFDTLQAAPFDQIERHYALACTTPKTAFLGYTVRQSNETYPGAAVVLPPNWSRHPDYPLAHGLSAVGGTDLAYMKDEIIRSMRNSDVMIGSGMKIAPSTCIQTFPADQVIRQLAVSPNSGATLDSVVKSLAPSQETYNGHPIPPEPTVKSTDFIEKSGNVARLGVFSKDEKQAVIAVLGSLGVAGMKAIDAARHGITLADDEDYANDCHRATHSWKIKAGTAKKKAAAKTE